VGSTGAAPGPPFGSGCPDRRACWPGPAHIDGSSHAAPKRVSAQTGDGFAAEQNNERWQVDFTHWWLADHTHVEILDFIDDRARYDLGHRPPPRDRPIVPTEFPQSH
jgi:hypothetical protein